jgi:addiction module HigA family antidote
MSPKQRAPITPGEILLTEFLEPKGLSQAKLAALLKIPLQRINLVVKGKRRITAEMALLFGQGIRHVGRVLDEPSQRSRPVRGARRVREANGIAVALHGEPAGSRTFTARPSSSD